MNVDVFMSYHTNSSRLIMESIVEKLERAGVRCWYAPRNVEGTYAGCLTRAIESCSIFLLILNKPASESRHVINELDIAFSNRKIKIMPFHVADDQISSDARYYLSGLHWIDGRTPPLSTRIDELCQRVINALRNASSVGQTAVGVPASNLNTGTVPYGNGATYTGTLLQNIPHGRGKCMWPNGDQYEGDFVNGKMSGRGKLTWRDGSTYTGDFIDGKRTGKGRLEWSDGDVYEGDFVDGQETGKGKFLWNNGDRYEGDFIDGRQTGRGRLTWIDGDEYEGDFFNGECTGKGKYTWSDGDVYVGDFVNGMKHGIGVLTENGGKVFSGRFRNDRFMGPE